MKIMNPPLGNCDEMECDVATSWQLWGLSGNYGIYVAVTRSTWR